MSGWPCTECCSGGIPQSCPCPICEELHPPCCWTAKCYFTNGTECCQCGCYDELKLVHVEGTECYYRALRQDGDDWSGFCAIGAEEEITFQIERFVGGTRGLLRIQRWDGQFSQFVGDLVEDPVTQKVDCSAIEDLRLSYDSGDLCEGYILLSAGESNRTRCFNDEILVTCGPCLCGLVCDEMQITLSGITGSAWCQSLNGIWVMQRQDPFGPCDWDYTTTLQGFSTTFHLTALPAGLAFAIRLFYGFSWITCCTAWFGTPCPDCVTIAQSRALLCGGSSCSDGLANLQALC